MHGIQHIKFIDTIIGCHHAELYVHHGTAVFQYIGAKMPQTSVTFRLDHLAWHTWFAIPSVLSVIQTSIYSLQ
jgi:hypothetical protein